MADIPTDVTRNDGAPLGSEHIVDHRLIEEMQDSYLTHSMSVIMFRALQAD